MSTESNVTFYSAFVIRVSSARLFLSGFADAIHSHTVVETGDTQQFFNERRRIERNGGERVIQIEKSSAVVWGPSDAVLFLPTTE